MRVYWKQRVVVLAGCLAGAALFVPGVRAQEAGATATKMMAADADPSFDVATIKLNNTGAQDHNINVSGRHLTMRNMPLREMIASVYELQTKQVAGGPDWMDKEMWDISGVPDKEGVPTEDQWKVMMKKLMAERFHLRFHLEKREMGAYVLSAPKGAGKLTVNPSGRVLPSFNMSAKPGAVTIEVRNAKMQDLCEFMQVRVLERPMVDQTGLSGRYDFAFTFLPDGSQLNGRMPPDALPDSPPVSSLYTAMEEQDGLKLVSTKAPVPVMMMDGVDRPSEN
jgi:uncharacterized protein (TIGR03435 family)